jgi:hypothetical protein
LLAEYFDAIFHAKLGNGSLQKKRKEQIHQAAKNKLQQELKKCYKRKVRAYVDHRMHGCHVARAHHHDHDKYYGRRCKDSHSKVNNKNEIHDRTHKTSGEGQMKKPCHVHGPEAKHSYDDCRRNPKNQCTHKNNNHKFIVSKKTKHKVHYHNESPHGSSDGSVEDPECNLADSESEISKNSSAKDSSLKNYHLETYHIPKKLKAGFWAGKRHIIRDLNSHEPENLQRKMFSQMASPFNLNLENIFPDDSLMNSFASSEDDQSCKIADAFNFSN